MDDPFHLHDFSSEFLPPPDFGESFVDFDSVIVASDSSLYGGGDDCPYERADSATLEGYFSTNLESVWKHVECTFGILKKRWSMLNDGLHYRDIQVCEKIFVTCCCLHNLILDDDDSTEQCSTRVARGMSIRGGGGGGGIWLDRHITHPDTENESMLSIQFGRRQSLLANHLKVFRRRGSQHNSQEDE